MRLSLARLRASLAFVLVGTAFALAGCSGAGAVVDGSNSSSGSNSSGGSSGASSGGTTPEAPSSTFGGAASGCGDVFAYRSSDDGTQFVTVQLDRNALGMKLGETRTIDLATAPSSVKVKVDVFARRPKDAVYCNDVVSESISSTSWTAEAGTLVIELGTKQGSGETYPATVKLRDVRLVGPERGTSILVPEVEIKNVTVGWLAG